jgi:allantoinase
MDHHYNDRNIHAGRMDHDHHTYSAFRDRPRFEWPNGARMALTVVVSVEFQDLILPDNVWRPAGSPVHLDLRNWSHRDYGSRVGIFRLAEILQFLGIPATIPISDAVLTRSPRVAEFIAGLGWELAGHGAKSNHLVTSVLSEEEEYAYLEASRSAIEAVTGVKPRGWLGPLQSESHRTPELLARAGYDYTLDWSNDDQPYPMTVREGRLMALPASVETSDYYVIDQRNHSPLEFEQVLRDHFDMLYEESATTGMAMTVNLQAHRSGQPFRSKYIRRFLEHAAGHQDVWFTTGSMLADAAKTALGRE